MADTNAKIKVLLEANHSFAEAWHTPPTMDQMRAAQGKTGGATVVRTSAASGVNSSKYFLDS